MLANILISFVHTVHWSIENAVFSSWENYENLPWKGQAFQLFWTIKAIIDLEIVEYIFASVNILFYCLTSLVNGKHVCCTVYQKSIFLYHRKLMMWWSWPWQRWCSKLVAYITMALQKGQMHGAVFKHTYFGSILFLHYCQKML